MCRKYATVCVRDETVGQNCVLAIGHNYHLTMLRINNDSLYFQWWQVLSDFI